MSLAGIEPWYVCLVAHVVNHSAIPPLKNVNAIMWPNTEAWEYCYKARACTYIICNAQNTRWLRCSECLNTLILLSKVYFSLINRNISVIFIQLLPYAKIVSYIPDVCRYRYVACTRMHVTYNVMHACLHLQVCECSTCNVIIYLPVIHYL
jgi:hypothetical protein